MNSFKLLGAIEYHNKRDRDRKSFYDKRRYMELIDSFMDMDINNDVYDEFGKWTSEVDDMFSFLYDNAYQIELFYDDEVVVKQGNKYISLFEIRGQGCYRSVEPVDDTDSYVEFNDIVTYHETGKKPIRSIVMEIVSRSLDVLQVATEGLESNLMDIDEVKEYIEDNLK